MAQDKDKPWKPFRPGAEELKTIAEDVSEIRDIQQTLRDECPGLHLPDRVAHQYQIAGGKVLLRVGAELPDELLGVGLFQPDSEHVGVGRVSTGLGTPHLETNPDFLGLMAAFQTGEGQRVDFLGLNSPAAPTDDHRQFVDLLHATGKSAGARIPLIGDWGEYDAGTIAAEQTALGLSLLRRPGPIKGTRILTHITRQTLRTFRSSTAYQPYWTGIVEASGMAGKFTLVPAEDVNRPPGFRPGERHFSDDWKARQKAGDLTFRVWWIPYRNEKLTPTVELAEAWNEDHKQEVGTIVFPRTEPDSEEAELWAILASEMGANPGNWVHDRGHSIAEPATEFGTARKLAYRLSQEGRGALDPAQYREVFTTGEIGPELARELRRRRAAKEEAGHVDRAPASS